MLIKNRMSETDESPVIYSQRALLLSIVRRDLG